MGARPTTHSTKPVSLGKLTSLVGGLFVALAAHHDLGCSAWQWHWHSFTLWVAVTGQFTLRILHCNFYHKDKVEWRTTLVNIRDCVCVRNFSGF